MLLNQRRIFIVEDNIQNRVIFQVILIKHGANVEFERWGRDTISRLKNFASLDLILLDLMLPGGTSGYDIYDKIRADLPRLANVPIAAVSAADPSVAMPKVRAKGFNGFIAKPIDDQLFPKQLAQLINHESVWHTGEIFHPEK